ncbi:hypothetical protein [Providencia huaxiensis]
MNLIFSDITFIFGAVAYMVANVMVIAIPVCLYILTRPRLCIILGVPI